MANGHKHGHNQSVERAITGYRGGIWPTEDGGQNPAAAGGVRYTETCRCGASRAVNSNGRHEERGLWESPDVGVAAD